MSLFHFRSQEINAGWRSRFVVTRGESVTLGISDWKKGDVANLRHKYSDTGSQRIQEEINLRWPTD